jgi:hypothetical protein
MPDIRSGILGLRRLQAHLTNKIADAKREGDMKEALSLVQKRDGVGMSIQVLQRMEKKNVEII